MGSNTHIKYQTVCDIDYINHRDIAKTTTQNLLERHSLTIYTLQLNYLVLKLQEPCFA